MDGEAKLQETELPAREAFFSRLRQEECSTESYAHAQQIWHDFGCSTIREYHDLYLRCDVLQLADVFEAFRSMSLREYGLDPVHYVSAQHQSMDAMLRTTR
jgi:hypothetical protein